MSDTNRVPCLACENGSMRAVFEPYPVVVAEGVTVFSDPVRFIKCDSCGDVKMEGPLEKEQARRSTVRERRRDSFGHLIPAFVAASSGSDFPHFWAALGPWSPMSAT
jgi:hypothetical protein